MYDVKGELEDLASMLTTAGLPAGIDTAKLNPPCAWVHSDKLTIDRLDGGATLTVFVDLITPAWSLPQALDKLSEMLEMTLTVITPDGDVDTDRGVELANDRILPAFRVPVNLDL